MPDLPTPEDLPDIGHKPHVKMANGEVVRVGWPTALVYVPTENPDNKELPWPPTKESHPGPPVPFPLVGFALPHSVAFLVVEKDADACRILQASGWLRDPLHCGYVSKLTDNRTARLAKGH